MTVSVQTVTVVNVIILVFYVLMALIGYYKGIVRSLTELLGSLVVGYVAWLICPVISNYIHVLPRSLIPMQNTVFASAVNQYMNELIWFIILFVVGQVIVALFGTVMKGAKDVPGIHFASGILGSLFHLCIAVVWTMAFCVILSLPMVKNGNQIIDNTLLSPIQKIVTTVAYPYMKPYIQSFSVSEFIENGNALTEKNRALITEWLESHGYQAIKDQVNQ